MPRFRLIAIPLIISAFMVSSAVAEEPLSASGPLAGTTVVIVLAEGYHDHEFWFPYYRFREAGAEVIVAGPKKGVVLGEGRSGKDGLPARITHTIEEVADGPIDCLYLPGGVWAPLTLRHHGPTKALVRKCLADDVPVAAICHASWILVSADVVKGRKIACPGDMAVDVTNAGGEYVKDASVRDGNLITAVFFGYLPQHFRQLMPLLTERAAAKRAN